MISNFLFAALAQDDTDVTAASVLSNIQARMGLPELVAGDLPPYTYQSLKTLLGETSNTVGDGGYPQWAIDRIKIVKAGKKFVSIEEPENLPLIKIAVSDVGYDGKAQNTNRQSANVSILVQTNPKQVNSTESYNIDQRIKALMLIYTISGVSTQNDFAQSITGIKGLANLTIQWMSTPVSSWDVHHSIYKAHATVIQ